MPVSFITWIVLIKLSYLTAFMLLEIEQGAEPKGICRELQLEYAHSAANFTRCFIENAYPIKVCQNCKEHYKNESEIFKEICDTSDTDNVKCKLILFNVDRLDVLMKNHEYIENQWKSAYCEKCLDSHTGNLNNVTNTILELYDDLVKCELQFQNSTVCTDCSHNYDELNSFYDGYKSFNGFCMDILDMMNRTRSHWSITLGCCPNRRQNHPIFFIFVSSLCFLPVIFYFFIWWCAKDAFQKINFRESLYWTSKYRHIPSASS